MKKNKTLIISIPFMIILAGLLAYQYGYLRIQSELATIREEQAIKTKTLGKYINLISEKPSLEKQLATLKEIRKADDSKLIEGQTPTLAAAQLQEKVKNTITGRSGTLSSERVGKPEDSGKFRIITCSVDASLPDPRSLTEILYSIETGTPYLVVKELDARLKNFRDPRELMIKLDVAALTSGK